MNQSWSRESQLIPWMHQGVNVISWSIESGLTTNYVFGIFWNIEMKWNIGLKWVKMHESLKNANWLPFLFIWTMFLHVINSRKLCLRIFYFEKFVLFSSASISDLHIIFPYVKINVFHEKIYLSITVFFTFWWQTEFLG